MGAFEWSELADHVCQFVNSTLFYYMAGFASGQDEVNPVFLLATRADKMGLSCPLGISRFVLAKPKFFGVIFWPHNKSFIVNVTG